MHEYAFRSENEQPIDDLVKLAVEMVPFFMSHNAEPDACDLLLELEMLEKIPDFLDKNTFARVALYLTSCANFVAAPEDVKALRVVHTIYQKYEKWPEALTIALKLNDIEVIKNDYNTCPDPFVHALSCMQMTQF